MKNPRLKNIIAKTLLTFLLLAPLSTATIPSARASLEPLIFSENTNIVDFTQKLIFKNSSIQKESSLEQNKDGKNNKEFWIRFKAVVERLYRAS